MPAVVALVGDGLAEEGGPHRVQPVFSDGDELPAHRLGESHHRCDGRIEDLSVRIGRVEWRSKRCYADEFEEAVSDTPPYLHIVFELQIHRRGRPDEVAARAEKAIQLQKEDATCRVFVLSREGKGEGGRGKGREKTDLLRAMERGSVRSE